MIGQQYLSSYSRFDNEKPLFQPRLNISRADDHKIRQHINLDHYVKTNLSFNPYLSNIRTLNRPETSIVNTSFNDIRLSMMTGVKKMLQDRQFRGKFEGRVGPTLSR